VRTGRRRRVAGAGRRRTTTDDRRRTAADQPAVPTEAPATQGHLRRTGYYYYYYYYFLTPVLNSRGMKKLRYAIQKSTKIKLE